MKTFIIFFLLPLRLFSQDISGIWTGFLNTNGNNLPYELVISEQKDKLSGYSLTIFIFDGIENIGIKSIKLKSKNGSVSLEDNDLVYDNYTTPPKRVQLIGRLNLKIVDSAIILHGSFTTRSPDFREQDHSPFSGTIHLTKQSNLKQTRLIAKLDELKLLNTLSFIRPEINEKEDIARLIPPAENSETSVVKEIQKESISSNLKSKDQPPVVKSTPEKDETPAQTGVNENDKSSIAQEIQNESIFSDIKPKFQPPAVELTSNTDHRANATLQKENNKPPVANDKAKEAVTAYLNTKEQIPVVELTPKKDETTVAIALKDNNKSALTKQKEKDIASAAENQKEKPPVTVSNQKKDESSIAIVSKENNKPPLPAAKEKETVSVPAKTKEQATQVKPKPKKDESTIANVSKENNKAPLPGQNEKVTASALKTKEQPIVVEQKPKEIITIQPSTTVTNSRISVQQAAGAAAEIDTRKTEIIRTVYYLSDSLVVNLYDNGEIDGDIVSVVLNGRVIIAKNELNANPIRIVIHITPDLGDSLHFVMYAENLGRIPPNTGLLILNDGDERHEIRFAGDLQKNAGIVLKRRR